MNRRLLTVILAAVVASGCGNRKTESFKALPFPDVQLPSVISSQHEVSQYMVEHFWDALTDSERKYPSDSLLVSGVLKSEVEQKFSNWVNLFDYVDLRTTEKAIGRLYGLMMECESADSSSNVFETFAFLAEKYLYNVNSPFRNEEHYLHFASRLSEYSGFSQEDRDKFSFHAKGCALNRIGKKAADFRFADNRGRVYTLYGIDSPYTLLFFSNPGCHACMDIINMLKGNGKVSQMISDGTLAVLNIYIDEDLQAWKDYMPVYPEEWYNCFDPDLAIRTDGLYSVRAIPSLYVLDKEKRVILKDAPENKVMSYLAGL